MDHQNSGYKDYKLNMKTKHILLSFALAAGLAASAHAVPLLQFDFAGSTATATYNTQPSTFDETGIVASSMTRGAGISTQNASNSFRGTGFSNNGISTSNTDFFQWTLAADDGFQFTVESIYGNFNGTSTFSNSPGVTMAYAYSLDGGSNFTLMSSFVQIGSGNQTYTIAGANIAPLTDITSVIFRFYASGQTTTGGWGLQSASSAGTIGLQVNGTVESIVPEPSISAALLGIAVLGLVAIRRRRHQ